MDEVSGAVVVGAANQSGSVQGVLTSFRAGVPQYYVDVDRVKAKSMRVPLSEVFDTLQIYLGSLYVNDFNLFGRTYQVTAQADAAFRKKPRDILDLKTRNAAGEMVPLGTLVNVRSITGPDKIVRYNMFPSAELTGTAAPGISTGQAIATMERLARENLPLSMGFEWTELTFQAQFGPSYPAPGEILHGCRPPPASINLRNSSKDHRASRWGW